MLFRIKADAIFEADDIDDAFERLAAHFKGLADDESALEGHMIEQGHIEIVPEERK